MAVLIGDLYRNTQQQFKMKLIAGSSGLNRIVNWVYLAEDITNKAFIEGNELIISTAFALSFDPDWLEPFILTMIEQDTSGLILNVGKYVTEEDITPEIVAMCEEYHYPLLTIPWEIHLSRLTQDYWDRIFTDRQNTYDLESAVKSLLRDEAPDEKSLETFHSRYWSPDDTYAIAVSEFSCAPETKKHCGEQIRRHASFCRSIRGSEFISLEYKGMIFFVWHNVEEPLIGEHVSELLSSCRSVPELEDIRVGISQVRVGRAGTTKMYRQAAAALCVSKHGSSPVFWFKDLGCYQLLFEVADRELLEEYYRKYLRVLEEYDSKHGSNYLETLECYLKHGQHLAETAEAMICHRNTVNYRVNKIRDLLGADLNDAEVKFQLMLAINIRNFLAFYEEPDQ